MMEEERVEGVSEQNGVSEEATGEDALKKALEEEKARSDDYLAKWQRAQADFINYKRRNEKEREELGELIRSLLIVKLLPVLDDFDRAVSADPGDSVDSTWVEGVRMIERKLRTIMEAEGLSTITAVGETFDPYMHEAVRQMDGEEGRILYEVQKGYKFNDKIIRASQVIVGNGNFDEKE